MTNNLMFIEEELPMPLNREEFIKYFQQYTHGDMEARNILINSNIRLVINRVHKKFNGIPYEKKDLVSVGIEGLINAVDTFDVSKNNAFSTYATWCIDNIIRNYIRDNKKYTEVDSFERKIDKQNMDGKLRVEDSLYDNSSNIVLNYEIMETNQEIRELINDLPPRDKEIIMLHFGFYDDRCYSQAEIGRMFNTSRANISRIVKKVLKQMQSKLKSSFSEKVKTLK